MKLFLSRKAARTLEETSSEMRRRLEEKISELMGVVALTAMVVATAALRAAAGVLVGAVAGVGVGACIGVGTGAGLGDGVAPVCQMRALGDSPPNVKYLS